MIRKRTPRIIRVIKNHSICIKIRGEIKEKNLIDNSNAKREKTKNLSKLQLIYFSKLNHNDRG